MEEYIEIIKMYEQANPKMDFLLWFTQNYKRLKEAENKALALLSVRRFCSCSTEKDELK